MIPFTSLLQPEPLAINHTPDPECNYTRIQFLNAVITGVPDREGEGQEMHGMPAPALLFKDTGGREITILIRKDEARTVKDVLEGHPERATVYELVVALLGGLDMELIGTFVYDLADLRYLSKLRLKNARTGDIIEMECRPSDAILLSLLGKRPVYIKSTLMEEFSIDLNEIFAAR